MLYQCDLNGTSDVADMRDQIRYLTREEVMAESIVNWEMALPPPEQTVVDLPEGGLVESLLHQSTPEELEVERQVREILKDQERRQRKKLAPRKVDPQLEEICTFAAELVKGTLEFRDEIDRRICALSENWRLDRMAIVDRNILRLGAYEILYRPDIPPKAAINEAVELAKEYSDEKSAPFVNGILDALAEFRLKAAQENLPSETTGLRADGITTVQE